MGICTSVALSDDLALIGQYGVRQRYQGIGIGSALWQRTVQRFGSHKNLLLYSAEEMVQKYLKKGFFESGIDVMYFYGKPDCSQLSQSIAGISVVPINAKNIAKVLRYDQQICDGMDRTLFIKALSEAPQVVTAVAVDRNCCVVGYAVLCMSIGNRYRTDQIYANTGAIAELLLSHCWFSVAKQGVEELVFRFWKCNQYSMGLAERLGLVFEARDSLLSTHTVKYEGFDLTKIFCPSSLFP